MSLRRDFLARLESLRIRTRREYAGTGQGAASVAQARLVARVQRLSPLLARRRFPLHRLGPLRPQRQALHQAVQGRGRPAHVYLSRRERVDGLPGGRPQISIARSRPRSRSPTSRWPGRPRDGARAGGDGAKRRCRRSSTDAIGSSSLRGACARSQAGRPVRLRHRRWRANCSRFAAPAKCLSFPTS